METCERTGKAVGRVIAVLHRSVYHLYVGGGKLLRRQREPAAADIFPHRKAAQHGEYPLKVKG